MSDHRDIGWAVKQMWNGERVARAGWNGRGMWLALVTDWTFNVLIPEPDNSANGKSLPFIMMRTAQVDFVPWLASQTDILATDWTIAGEELP